MHAQSTFLGAALLVATAMAAPVPQITTTVSQPILGWPGSQVSSTEVNLQAGDYVPPFSWGGIVTPAGQYDGECSVYRRYRGDCTLDQPYRYSPYGGYRGFGGYNDYYDRAVNTDATTDSTIEKRQVVGSQGLSIGGSSFSLNGSPTPSLPAGASYGPGTWSTYNPYGYLPGSQSYLNWLNFYNVLRPQGYRWVPFGTDVGYYPAGGVPYGATPVPVGTFAGSVPPVVGSQGLSIGSSSFHLDNGDSK